MPSVPGEVRGNVKLPRKESTLPDAVVATSQVQTEHGGRQEKAAKALALVWVLQLDKGLSYWKAMAWGFPTRKL